MQSLLYGLLGFGFPFVSTIAAVFAARVLVGGALGIEDLSFRPRNKQRTGAPVAPAKQLLVVLACVLATYLVPVVLFTVAIAGKGVPVKQADAQVIVDVIMERSADDAGMEDGDRIMQVGDTPIERWADLPPAVQAHAGETIVFVVERGGERVELPVDIAPNGTVGVQLQLQNEEVGVGSAFVEGLKKPVVVAYTLVGGLWTWLTGEIEAELGGPAMIVKESSRAAERSIFDWFYLLAALTTYFGLPLGLGISIALRPKRH